MVITTGMSHFPKECALHHSTYPRMVPAQIKHPESITEQVLFENTPLEAVGRRHVPSPPRAPPSGPPRGLTLLDDEALLLLHFSLSVTAVVDVCLVPKAQLISRIPRALLKVEGCSGPAQNPSPFGEPWFSRHTLCPCG